MLPFQVAIPRPVMRSVREQNLAPVELPMRRVAPPGGALAAKERRQRQAVALRRHFDTHGLANRGEDIDVFCEGVDRGAMRCGVARIADDSGDVVAGFEEAELLEEAVVTELLAVVGRDDAEGVVPLTGGAR